jgi:starch phosphorylase
MPSGAPAAVLDGAFAFLDYGTMKPKLELPVALAGLERLAYNLRWTWDRETRDVFRGLDGEAWRRTRHNPVQLLRELDRDALRAAAADDGIVKSIDCAIDRLESYMRQRGVNDGPRRVAYFSAEFAITECIRVFSGGLGVLAGDHLKSASDLGLPLVGVGLLYRDGYFSQHVDARGWQYETYRPLDPSYLPLRPETTSRGAPLLVRVPFPGREVHARIWCAQVGTIPLYLLDTDVAPNTPADRHITDRLYGGDNEHRIKQELVLGIGGVRALAALGHEIEIFHLNEGHAAFAILERVRGFVNDGMQFDAAFARAARETVFTTHTPVEAGHDYFSADLMQRYFGEWAAEVGAAWQRFHELGATTEPHRAGLFCMTALALRGARARNAVSRLHGVVSRQMWHGLWSASSTDAVPIGHVTNGVHLPSWVGPYMSAFYSEAIAPDWQNMSGAVDWARIRDASDGGLWKAHGQERSRLAERFGVHLAEQARTRGEDFDEAVAAVRPDALTITFARRFATYKRATLLLRDVDRLARIIGNPDRPVQILFAGKSHPRDDGGKHFLREVFELSRRPPFVGRIFFVENYDIELARYLVRGSDVWLNVPRRPYEASGTSGMKSAANGGLNLSIADGWWAEAWTDRNTWDAPIGWVIGGTDHFDPAEQDAADAASLYDALESEIVPAFYERDANGLPQAWIARMRSAIGQIAPFFNTDRMVAEYASRYYRLSVEESSVNG